MTRETFFTTIFDKGERTCFSADPYGISLKDAHSSDDRAVFFALNPLREARADANVTCYRNILVEMDKVPLDEQLTHITTLEMPWSTITYSGSKSYHFIISLYEPCTSRAEYDDLVDRIYTIVGKDKIDTKCKNPSRFTRVPGALRPDTGLKQNLVKCFYRVTRADLDAWIAARLPANYGHKHAQHRSIGRFKLTPSGRTLNFMMFGAGKGEWNNELFIAACDLFRCGLNRDQVENRLRKPTGHLDRFDLRSIDSAETSVMREIRQSK